MVQDGSRVDHHPYSRRTLRFSTPAVEAAFVQSKHEKLRRSFTVGLIFEILFAVGATVSILVFEEESWSVSSQHAKFLRAQTILVAWPAVVSIFLMILLHSSWFKARISGSGLELLISASVCLASIALIAMHPWNLANMMSINDPGMFDVADAKLLLDIDVLLTVVHFLLPIRFPFLIAINFFTFALYCTSLFVIGPQKGSGVIVGSIITMLVLILADLWGKRLLETLERTTFAQIRQEITFRYESECQVAQQYRAENKTK
eukprot:TRINITY_DN9111_c5_g1_i1.p1 TRINITY_DN9111_c5_g1~~TRINITY_DN9111_c5_g1_i1.p1  ORF type:complete len:271 (-),score=15.72 TRINITY_DN9111_c5_g1_i1:6-788(-)